MIESIGRFHPVLVHLPIGMLLLGILFYFLSLKEKYHTLSQAAGLSFLSGAVAGILSCITGYLLSQSGEYDAAIVGRHQWLGIVTTVLAVVIYLLYQKNYHKKIISLFAGVLLLLVTITGHLGGTLTHGSNYLFSGGETANAFKRQPIANVPEAKVYTDIVAPLLQEKCYSCHGSNKQKGKLRLDDPEAIIKGGKNGAVLKPGNAGASELIKRVLLPTDNDKHMPPKEKPQLSENDIALLHWWISNQASFTQTVKELPQDERIKPILAALSNEAVVKQTISPVPDAAVSKADEKALAALKQRGVLIQPVAQNSNYLTANFVSTPAVTDKDLLLLQPLQQQLVWLKLSNQKITDAGLTTIKQFTNLTRLQLDRTAITDAGLINLNSLQQLQYLNLVGTAVTGTGLKQLTGLKKLQSLYLYQTGITPGDWQMLTKQFNGVQIDTGGYRTNQLTSDTQDVKAPK